MALVLNSFEGCYVLFKNGCFEVYIEKQKKDDLMKAFEVLNSKKMNGYELTNVSLTMVNFEDIYLNVRE